MQRRQYGFGVVEIMVIVTVVAVLGVGGWYIWRTQQTAPSTALTPPPPAPNSEPTLSPQATTKKYTNTKYGYSFEYPAEAEIYSDIPYGGVKTPITSESDIAIVSHNSNTFTVFFTGYNTPTLERIRQDFGATPPQDIDAVSVQIGQSIGLKAVFKNQTVTVTTGYYFLQKAPGSPVAKLIVGKDLDGILNSFRFE